MTLCALTFIFIVNSITAGICGNGRPGDDCAPAVPMIHTLFVIVVGTCLAFGLGMLLGATNQSLGLQSSMLLQMVWGGALLKGDIVANIIVAAVNNAVVAQSLSLLSDYRAGLLLKISPRVMFLTQLLGTAVGVLASTGSYMMVIALSQSGTIDLNQSLWPNTGAQTTNSKKRRPPTRVVLHAHVHSHVTSRPHPLPPPLPLQCSPFCSRNTVWASYSSTTQASAPRGTCHHP